MPKLSNPASTSKFSFLIVSTTPSHFPPVIVPHLPLSALFLLFLLCNILPLYTLTLFASSSFLVLFFISLNTSWLVLVILSHFLPLHLHPLFLFFLFLLPLLFSSLFFPMSNYCSSFSSALFLFSLLFGVLLFLLLTNCSICLFILFLDSPPNNQITL